MNKRNKNKSFPAWYNPLNPLSGIDPKEISPRLGCIITIIGLSAVIFAIVYAIVHY